MRMVLVAIILTLIVGCAKQLPPMLPAVPTLTQELRSNVWPRYKQLFRLEGTLSIFSRNIPIRGFVSADYSAGIVKIALLTQMGTSVFEATITRKNYILAAESPLLKKYPSITSILIKMVRAIYLPPPVTLCTAEAQDNTAYLRCEEDEVLSVFQLAQTSLCAKLISRIDANAETELRMTSWNSESERRYPEKIMYSDYIYGLTATFTQSILNVSTQRPIEN